METIGFILLEIVKRIHFALPVAVEVRDDRKGDHNKKQDVVVRSILCAIVSLFDHFINGANLLAAFGLSVAFFIATFDYSFNKWAKIDGAKRPVFKYLSDGGVDSWKPWVWIRWQGRLAVRMLLLGLSIWIYVMTLK